MKRYTYAFKGKGYTLYASKTSHATKASKAVGGRNKSGTSISEQLAVSLLKACLKPKR